MQVDMGQAAESFREEIRPWLEANRIPGLEGLAGAHTDPTHHRGGRRQLLDEWVQRLAEQRLICPGWPEAYGGRGLGPLEMAVLQEELLRVEMPRVVRGMGENLVGPSLIVHGTLEQKARFLPRIVGGEDRYCQGFSEPNAGSDLAGLQTRGEVDGDEIIISGQKVWTSWHREATAIFTLCRTDEDAPKHQGISYVLVPKEQPGIEVRPLQQMTGGSEFAEVFFTGARAPLFNVVGGVNGGWKVAMTTLGNERGGRATTQHLQYERELRALVHAAQASGRADEPLVRQELAWAHTHVQIMRFSGLRTIAALVAGREPGPEASITKLFWSEYHRRFGEIALTIGGPQSMVLPEKGDDIPLDVFEGPSYRLDAWQQAFLGSRAGTIYAGTSEIQRNIIGERALGLPKEPRPTS